jgi:hypothetical protein
MDAAWESKVRERAYTLWEDERRPEGGAERPWAQAKEEFRAEERDRTDALSTRAAGTEAQTELAGSEGRRALHRNHGR